MTYIWVCKEVYKDDIVSWLLSLVEHHCIKLSSGILGLKMA